MLTVGQLARATGVRVQTVHFYEREHILPKAARTPSGYRKFPEESVQVIRFVKQAQELGFSLQEIRELLRLRLAPPARCEKAQEIASKHILSIEQKMDQLQRMKSALEVLVRCCQKRDDALECPILEAFEKSA